jgi:hypothetical protein
MNSFISPSLTILITSLCLWVLLDRSQQEVLEDLTYEYWKLLHDNHNVHQLIDLFFQSLTLPSRPSCKTIAFLCSYNNVQHDGNSAAHSASKEDVKAAVCRKPIDSKYQWCLEEMYIYAFGNEI